MRCLSFCLVSVLYLAACDNAFRPASTYDVSGNLDLGVPVSGATVKLLSLPDNELLGSTVTDGDGKFSISLTTPHKGSARIIVSNGSAKDPISKASQTLVGDESLVWVLPTLKNESEINLNVWTMLASARALGLSGPSLSDGLQTSLVAFEKHLGDISLTSTKSCPLFSKDCQSNLKALFFSLSQLGFFQMAKDNDLTLVALLSLLAKDVSDGVFDGKAGKEQLFLKGRALNAHFLGFELAKSIDRYLSSIGTHTQNTDFFSKVLPLLNGKEGFYRTLTRKQKSELFSEDYDPKPFINDVDSILEEVTGTKPRESTPINVIIDLNSDSYDYSNDPKDIGFKDYTTSDAFYFDQHPVLKSGFVVGHAVISNLMNEPVAIRVSDPVIRLAIHHFYGMWFPNKNGEGDKEKVCKLQRGGRVESFTTTESETSFVVHEFSVTKGVVGNEVPVDNDGTIRLQPKQVVLLRWLLLGRKDSVRPLLPKGQFPTEKTCKAFLNSHFIKTCGDLHSNTYFLDLCTGDTTINSNPYIQYPIIGGFETNNDGDAVEFWAETKDGKGERREAFPKGPFRKISK